MRDALVFNGISNLDFQDIRTNVVRIPEVVSRIREAQCIWDTISTKSLDLANFIGSEDAVFLGHIKLKAFATAVVQVGLLDRLLKIQKLPSFVVGMTNGDSPLLVAIGKMSFFDMVSESQAIEGRVPAPIPLKSSRATANTQGNWGSSAGVSDWRTGAGAVAGAGFSLATGARNLASGTNPPVGLAGGLGGDLPGGLPLLAGVHLAEYGAFRKSQNGEYEVMNSQNRDLERMIVELVEQHEVDKLVTVGPGNSVFSKKLLEMTSREVQVLESIDLDPMLSWFWSNLRGNRLAIAN